MEKPDQHWRSRLMRETGLNSCWQNEAFFFSSPSDLQYLNPTLHPAHDPGFDPDSTGAIDGREESLEMVGKKATFFALKKKK